jgi:hypothetical protein
VRGLRTTREAGFSAREGKSEPIDRRPGRSTRCEGFTDRAPEPHSRPPFGEMGGLGCDGFQRDPKPRPSVGGRRFKLRLDLSSLGYSTLRHQ